MKTVQRVGQAIALVGVAALLGLLVWKVAFDRDGGVAADLGKGTPVFAPEFTLDRLDRPGRLSMSDLRGKAVVVNFWASWCLPCRDEAPVLQQTFERYRGDGLVVLGVDFNDFKGDARRMLARYAVTYPNVFDRKGSTVGRYGITGVPETFFISRSGKVVARVPLPIKPETLDENIERALAIQ